MTKRAEISSTEQLLNLIRDDSSLEHSDFNRSAQKTIGPRLKGSNRYAVPFNKLISVGVDLGHDDLKLVKIRRISDQKYEMLGWKD